MPRRWPFPSLFWSVSRPNNRAFLPIKDNFIKGVWGPAPMSAQGLCPYCPRSRLPYFFVSPVFYSQRGYGDPPPCLPKALDLSPPWLRTALALIVHARVCRIFLPPKGVWGAAPCSPRALALGPAETVRAFAPWQADFQLRVQGCRFPPSYQSGIALRRSEHLPPGKPALSTASR